MQAILRSQGHQRGCREHEHQLRAECAIKNPAMADGVVLCECSAGGYIRNHTPCPAFPKVGSCMAFISVMSIRLPGRCIRRFPNLR